MSSYSEQDYRMSDSKFHKPVDSLKLYTLLSVIQRQMGTVYVTSSRDFISTLAGNQESSWNNEKGCLSSSIRTSFPIDSGQDTVKLDTWNKDRNFEKSLFDNQKRSCNVNND